MDNSTQSERVVKTPKCPVRDCPLPVDVVLRSSDKVLIGAHQTNLSQYSEGFPSPSDVSASDEPVDLTEDGDTLGLLMRFRHHQRHPSLHTSEMDVGVVFKLAEAAEKYLVYSAMNACNIRIDDPRVFRENSAEALKYAVKFNYPQLANRAGRWTLPKYSLEDMVKAFGAGNELAVLAWVRFREQYVVAMKDILQGSSGYLKVRGVYTECKEGHWDPFYEAVIADILRTSPNFLIMPITEGEHNNSLETLTLKRQHLIQSCSNGICTRRAANWRAEFSSLLQRIKRFDTFLPSR